MKSLRPFGGTAGAVIRTVLFQQSLKTTTSVPIMGSEIQRALLWILFGLSAFMLYDRWEVYNGRPSFFGAETQQTVSTTQNSVPTSSITPNNVPEEQAVQPPKADLVKISTDLVSLSIDPSGATIVHSELLKEKQQIPWTDTGLAGLVLGNKEKPAEDVVLFNQAKDNTYLAQTGLIGGPFPNHKTQFVLQPGPLTLEYGK
jgi:YidC/Oxa1 family membrane protein insertase